MFFNVQGEAGVPSGNPANLYTTVGVRFQGDRLHTSGADLTGNADSKLFTCSFWFKRFSTGSFQTIWHTDSDDFRINWQTDNTIWVNNSGGASPIESKTSAITDTDDWHQYLTSFDLSDTLKRHIYVDGISDANWLRYDDAVIDFTRAGHAVGSVESATGNTLNGELADFWFAPGQYIDLSLQGNRERFRDENGKPVDLGSDGSKPTGTQPLVFFKGAASVWNAGTNLGSAQNFTMVNSVLDAGSSPSD